MEAQSRFGPRRRANTGRFEAGHFDPSRRFWSKVDDSGDCWLWTANRTPLGYGRFSFNGEPQKAHRVAWILTHGEIPQGLNVLHRCDNPPCVRTTHLFIGTIMDNCHDMMRKGRMKEPPRGAANRAKTHCPKGHEYTPENTLIKRRKGKIGRACRACNHAYVVEKWQKYKRGEHPTGR